MANKVDKTVGIEIDLNTKKYKKGLDDQKGLTTQFKNNIEKIQPDFKKSIQSVLTYQGAIGLAAKGAKVMTEQLKSTQVGGNYLADRQQAHTQATQAFANAFVGVRVNIQKAMEQAIEYNKQLRSFNSQKLFGEAFIKVETDKMIEFDEQAKDVAVDILNAKKVGDQVQVEYHLKRMKEIFDQRNASLDFITEIQEKLKEQQNEKFEKSTDDFLSSVGLSRKQVEEQGFELKDLFIRQFTRTNSSNDLYQELEWFSKKVREDSKKAGKKNVNPYLEWDPEVLKQAIVFKKLVDNITNDKQKQFVTDFLDKQDAEQKLKAQNKKRIEDFEDYTKQMLEEQSKIGNINPFKKSSEKQLKTLSDLKKEASDLRTKISNTFDPYLLRQYNNELDNINKTIKSVTADLQIKPLEQKGVDKINPVLFNLKTQINDVKKQMKSTTELDRWNQLNAKLKELEQKYKNLNEAIKGGANISTMGVNKKLQELQQKNIEQIKKSFEGVDINLLIGLNDSKLYSDIINKQNEYNKQIEIQSVLYGKNSEKVKELKKELKDYNSTMGVTTTDNQKNLQDMGQQFGSLSQLMSQQGNKEQAMQLAIQQIIQGAAQGIGKQFSDNVWYGIQSAAQAQASVQAVISSFSSTSNKYATGGIVNGNSHNDGVPILQSAGELVLNRSQQRNLFNMLEYGDNSKNNFTLEVRGTSLEAVRQNTLNKNKKLNYRYD